MTDGGSPDFDSVFTPMIERIKNPSIYQSPFEQFRIRNPEVPFEKQSGALEYDGTLRGVVGELEAALKAPDQGENYKVIALHPSRLIRGVIDLKIEHSDQATIQDIQKVVQIGLAVYQRDPASAEMLAHFREEFGKNNPSVWEREIHQKKDLPTWYGTDPRVSYRTAQDFAFSHPGEDMLFIALAHGATAAGMDVFLRYTAITQTANEFYPARFSRLKKKDSVLQLNEAELAYLRQLSQQRTVVLFEEDSPTGTTAGLALNYLKENVSNQKPIINLSNKPTILSNQIISKSELGKYVK